jgi:hypothetical protein
VRSAQNGESWNLWRIYGVKEGKHEILYISGAMQLLINLDFCKVFKVLYAVSGVHVLLP